MYEIRFEETTRDGVYVVIENNRIYFESKEDAHQFVIELLKNTGRIGC